MTLWHTLTIDVNSITLQPLVSGNYISRSSRDHWDHSSSVIYIEMVLCIPAGSLGSASTSGGFAPTSGSASRCKRSKKWMDLERKHRILVVFSKYSPIKKRKHWYAFWSDVNCTESPWLTWWEYAENIRGSNYEYSIAHLFRLKAWTVNTKFTTPPPSEFLPGILQLPIRPRPLMQKRHALPAFYGWTGPTMSTNHNHTNLILRGSEVWHHIITAKNGEASKSCFEYVVAFRLRSTRAPCISNMHTNQDL